MIDTTVTIPDFQLQLTVKQLVEAVRRLDPEARTDINDVRRERRGW